jgi:hypothetical protein
MNIKLIFSNLSSFCPVLRKIITVIALPYPMQITLNLDETLLNEALQLTKGAKRKSKPRR